MHNSDHGSYDVINTYIWYCILLLLDGGFNQLQIFFNKYLP